MYGAARWVGILPRYFDYDIVNGPANTRVEWIRIYVPGPWHPVAENTLGPAPDDSTTYRESKCIGRGIAQAAPIQVLFRSQYLMHPSILGIIETGSPGDTNGWVVHIPVFASGAPDLMYAGLTSSSASSNSDGG